MAWARIDDGFVDHPKVLKVWQACPGAVGLHVRAIAYCSRHLTDGVITQAAVISLSPVQRDRDDQTAALVDGGVWYWDEANESFIIHDFNDYHPTKAELEAKREQERKRKVKEREAKR